MNTIIKKALALSAVCATLIGATAVTTASAKKYPYSGTDPVCGCWNEWTYTTSKVPCTTVSSVYLNGTHYHSAYVKVGNKENNGYGTAGNKATAKVNRGFQKGAVAQYNNNGCANPSNKGYNSWE